jgi:hypothetical protein
VAKPRVSMLNYDGLLGGFSAGPATVAVVWYFCTMFFWWLVIIKWLGWVMSVNYGFWFELSKKWSQRLWFEPLHCVVRDEDAVLCHWCWKKLDICDFFLYWLYTSD